MTFEILMSCMDTPLNGHRFLRTSMVHRWSQYGVQRVHFFYRRRQFRLFCNSMVHRFSQYSVPRKHFFLRRTQYRLFCTSILTGTPLVVVQCPASACLLSQNAVQIFLYPDGTPLVTVRCTASTFFLSQNAVHCSANHRWFSQVHL